MSSISNLFLTPGLATVAVSATLALRLALAL